VIGAAAIIDRGEDSAQVGIPLQSLVRLQVPAYSADVCPLCAKGIAIVKPGSRTN
jgi:orotate phosphoribosyltransferase